MNDEQLIRSESLPATEYRRGARIALDKVKSPYGSKNWRIQVSYVGGGGVIEWFKTQHEAQDYFDMFVKVHKTWNKRLVYEKPIID